jgi:hypothetical protein
MGMTIRGTAAYTFSAFLVIVLSLSTAGCFDTPTPTPVPTAAPSATWAPALARDPGPTADDFVASNGTVLAASIALSTGDRDTLLALLSSGSGRGLSADDLDLAGPGATKLADALANAQPVSVTSTSIRYEISVDGKKDYIYTVKEDGLWKLDA